uniref:Uncharacterized protein n=1 Tax=Paramormyrops kingsleyae TaxID=1676925 RepID=A0A3B3S319_9TELE
MRPGCSPTSAHINPRQPTSAHINPHQPTSTHVSPHQPTSAHISPHQPTSPHISLQQPTSVLRGAVPLLRFPCFLVSCDRPPCDRPSCDRPPAKLVAHQLWSVPCPVGLEHGSLSAGPSVIRAEVQRFHGSARPLCC